MGCRRAGGRDCGVTGTGRSLTPSPHTHTSKQLFLKPHDIYLSLERKAGAPQHPIPTTAATAATTMPRSPSLDPAPAAGAGGTIDRAAIPPNTRLLLLFGSNMGTCEGMAGELAQHVRGRWWREGAVCFGWMGVSWEETEQARH